MKFTGRNVRRAPIFGPFRLIPKKDGTGSDFPVQIHTTVLGKKKRLGKKIQIKTTLLELGGKFEKTSETEEDL